MQIASTTSRLSGTEFDTNTILHIVLLADSSNKSYTYIGEKLIALMLYHL